LPCFRTKVFLATSDEFTARAAAELCGRADRLKARYTLAEGGQGTHVSLLTGRAVAARQTLMASKTYIRCRLRVHRVCSPSSNTRRPSSCRTTD
jgi:hypothetical protein